MPEARRRRSEGETVFALLKVLMGGYVLWGHASGFDMPHLAQVLGVADGDLRAALDYLIEEGLAQRDAQTGRVRLTPAGARRLLVTGPRRPDRPCAVEFRASAWH